MIYLRQSTASQEIPLGPFVDSVDGDTEETALTIANTDIKIWKSGASAQVNKNSGGATHDADGIYIATLDATDTNTLGPMRIYVHVAGALYVWDDFFVLTSAAYDIMTGTTALGTAAEMADAVHDEVIENSLTFRQITRIMKAVISGKTTGNGLNFRDDTDSKNRLVVSTDANNNRSITSQDGT